MHVFSKSLYCRCGCYIGAVHYEFKLRKLFLQVCTILTETIKKGLSISFLLFNQLCDCDNFEAIVRYDF